MKKKNESQYLIPSKNEKKKIDSENDKIYDFPIHGFLQNNTLKSDKYDKYYVISKMCFYNMGNTFFFSMNSPCLTNRAHFSPLKVAYTPLIYHAKLLCRGIQIWTLSVTDFY